MKYVANPVVVEALKITQVHEGPNGRYWLELEDGTKPIAEATMCSRMIPVVGDYWVIQSDGYVYLNPKDVFERKYSPRNKPRPTIDELDRILNSEDSVDVTIMPDGSIQAKEQSDAS